MKTTKQVIDESGLDPALVRGVIRQLGGKDSLTNVCNHGADAGYSGFTYTRDTVAFYRRHRIAINDMVTRMADDLGENPVEMVAMFNCLGGRQARMSVNDGSRRSVVNEYTNSVGRCIYNGKVDVEADSDVMNALTWFALEEVARAFCDE